jgi:hypothetical protein
MPSGLPWTPLETRQGLGYREGMDSAAVPRTSTLLNDSAIKAAKPSRQALEAARRKELVPADSAPRLQAVADQVSLRR